MSVYDRLLRIYCNKNYQQQLAQDQLSSDKEVHHANRQYGNCIYIALWLCPHDSKIKYKVSELILYIFPMRMDGNDSSASSLGNISARSCEKVGLYLGYLNVDTIPANVSPVLHFFNFGHNRSCNLFDCLIISNTI